MSDDFHFAGKDFATLARDKRNTLSPAPSGRNLIVEFGFARLSAGALAAGRAILAAGAGVALAAVSVSLSASGTPGAFGVLSARTGTPSPQFGCLAFDAGLVGPFGVPSCPSMKTSDPFFR